MEACYGGTDVMERSCAVARGIDINMLMLCSYYIRTVRSDGSRLLSFESTYFLPIYHNSITSPSCYQELCLLYCTAYRHQYCIMLL
jgi:hypothetical protein